MACAANRPDGPPDADLVIAALYGDLRAFDELALRYRSALLLVAGQITGRLFAAEDVVQDALLLAFRALPQLDDGRRFAPWLYAITRHRALRYMEEEGRLLPRDPLDEFLIANTRFLARDPLEILEEAERRQAFQQAIAALAPELQLVLGLYYWEEMSQQQIADFLDAPLTTVKWRLHRAKRLLKRYLIRKEGRTHGR
jgi:RNA polymerase sigma-70 factor (ECF subfamily)